MNGKVIVGAVCLVIGGAVGYFVGGKTCADHYRNTIMELREELEEAEKKREPDISKEEIKAKTREVKEKYKSTEKDRFERYNKFKEKVKKDILEKYKIDEETYNRSVTIVDEKCGRELTFSNFEELALFLNPNLAISEWNELSHAIFGDEGMFGTLSSMYPSIKDDDTASPFGSYKIIADKYQSHENERPEDKKDDLDDPFDPDDIYLISDDEFRKDLNYRDSETITYYQEDHMLVDSADMPIHDEERVVGTEALDELPETEEDYLYVSNDIENKMYEIIVEHNQSFYRDVLGMEL